VRELLGTPLVTSVFHADRWDYVFTLKRQGVEPQQRKLTVFFKGDQLERFEGDTMPSEPSSSPRWAAAQAGKVPVLEATEEQLRAGASPNPARRRAAARAARRRAPPTTRRSNPRRAEPPWPDTQEGGRWPARCTPRRATASTGSRWPAPPAAWARC
jgi:outer membrane protein assembly factor BamE